PRSWAGRARWARPGCGDLVAVRPGSGSVGSGEAGVGVEVVGERRPAGPDPLAVVALQAAALGSVAALEVADAALGAGAVALLAALGASRPGLLAAGDEDPLWCQWRQRLAGRAGVEAAVERDLARTQA